ncbi:MAG: hypothetical protein NTY13_04675 [Chlamydiae bacterium]|nr:hypothetical protein [Chlamydiota bacterium]
MLSFKEESEISVCAHSMDRVMPAGLVEKSTAPVRKSIGLAKSLKSVLYFFTVLGLTSCSSDFNKEEASYPEFPKELYLGTSKIVTTR